MGALAVSSDDRKPPTIGVLLCNLGTPAAPTPRAVRGYLRQFLQDRWLIDAPAVRWFLVRHLVVVPLRSFRVARQYRAIWTALGSPLLVISHRQAAALERRLEELAGEHVQVAVAMRYGEPSLSYGLEVLRRGGCNRLLLLPLFPQYSATTVGSAVAAATAVLRSWPRPPEVRSVSGYAFDAGYIDALASSVATAWQEEGPAQRLLVSFHGLPVRYGEAGDPYPAQCRATAERLTAALGLPPGRWAIGFQSRFGREPWLAPAADELLAEWGRQRIDRVDAVCPGFAADCLETLEEVAVLGAERFRVAGGGRFRYLAALNDRPEHIEALARITSSNLTGWL